MKKNYKYLFMIIFFVSSFLIFTNVEASYTAVAFNPEGATCSLYKGSLTSTGYCYYNDSSLSGYTSNVIWLDTGDEVTVLEDGIHQNIESPNKSECSDYYVWTSFYHSHFSKTYHGYYCNANLKRDGEVSEELKQEFKDLGFPESYWSKLAILKEAHPTWNFIAINTGLKFNDVVTNQTYGAKSLLRKSMSNNYAYLDNSESSFDYLNDKYIAYDDTTGSDPWYKANYGAIAFYIDPRNFLSDMYIFQFETLSYNNTVDKTKLKNSIITIFEEDYLSKFADYFLEAAELSGVNPIYLASLSKEEIANGTTAGTAISGEYNGMYNFYNIGATGGENPVYRGLDFAANTDELTMRPWNTEYNAVVGGAKWIYEMFLKAGQDTSYFKKFNVVYNYLVANNKVPMYSNYDHQYMQNIKAPANEATTTYSSYYANKMLGLSYTFYIPVYLDMPEITTLPSQEGWPNNYLSTITLNENKIAEFNAETTTYNYNLDTNNPEIKIEAQPISSTAKISGTGTFKITEDTTKAITVTAENGNTKTYNIKIKLTGDKIESPIDVVTTLNNAGIKNGDKYITGLTVGSNIDVIKQKIVNANAAAHVSLKNSSDKEKNTGNVATGDKVVITVGNETKTYELIVYGDLTGDGEINNIDFIRLKKYLLSSITLSGPYKEASDTSKDGNINNIDFIRLKKYLLGDNTIITQ